MKKYLALLFAVFFFSCKTIKVVEKEYITKTDTVKDVRTEKIFQAVHDTTTIDNPCDSTGILKDFQAKIKVPQGKIIIRSVKGKIMATVNIDSIASVYEQKYRSNNRSVVKYINKEIEKKYIPTWIIIALILESILIISYLYFKFIKPF